MRIVIVIIFGLLVSACANDVPPINFSVPNVGPSAVKIPVEIKVITVTMARTDEQTGPMPPNAAPLAPYWKEAIQEALDKMAIFQDDAPKKISLSVKVLKIDLPIAGFSMTTDTAAHYELIDRTDGSVIYATDINASGTTPADYAFLGLARARESLNRSVQNNILQFLQALETVNINKPMFPAPSPAKKPGPNN
jgi:hypothetical protein